jgi:hypothetical protein
MKYKKDTNIVSTRQAVSAALCIPIEHVKAIKALDCPGCPTTGRYYLKEIKEWYDKNLDKVIEYCEDNTSIDNNGEWKKRKERAQALIAEIQLQTLQGNILDKNKTIMSIKRLLDSMAIMLKSMSQTLPHKVLGKGITETQIELDKSYDEICKIGLKELNGFNTRSN